MNTQIHSKKRFKCGEIKPIEEFYRHKKMADGHLNKCKDCSRKERREHERNNPQKVLESRLRTHANNPTSVSARRILDSAINAGQISRPDRCSGCGCSNKEHRIEAHHYDYTKPLDVIWLCTPCHRKMDMQRRIREQALSA